MTGFVTPRDSDIGCCGLFRVRDDQIAHYDNWKLNEVNYYETRRYNVAVTVLIGETAFQKYAGPKEDVIKVYDRFYLVTQTGS